MFFVKMKSAKLKQLVLSLLAITSLFASSVSACACSHHREKAEAESPSCHEHSPETKAGHNQHDDLAETDITTVSEAGCVCLQVAPKAFAKSDKLKFEKHIATIQIVAPIKTEFAAQVVPIKFNFTKPFYLSDSYYNLSPGRAPPVL